MRMFRGVRVVVPGTDALKEGEGRKVDVGVPGAGGVQVLLCRVDGKVYAIDTDCPHEGGKMRPGPLAEGKWAVCPLHSYRFDPKNGRVVMGSCAAAKTYRVKESGGECEIRI